MKLSQNQQVEYNMTGVLIVCESSFQDGQVCIRFSQKKNSNQPVRLYNNINELISSDFKIYVYTYKSFFYALHIRPHRQNSRRNYNCNYIILVMAHKATEMFCIFSKYILIMYKLVLTISITKYLYIYIYIYIYTCLWQKHIQYLSSVPVEVQWLRPLQSVSLFKKKQTFECSITKSHYFE